MKCPHCKNEIPADSKFCPDCGKPINGTSDASTSDSESGADTLEFTVGDVSFKMIRVEHGEFMMGATDEQENPSDDEKPAHRVTLTDDYYIGETQVTQALWEAVMGNNPSYFKYDNLPVENVSWDDCHEFTEKLNRMTGKRFRLPTEAEWEFAARGGNKSNHTQYSGSNELNDVAWHGNKNGATTYPIRTKKPNELGIYDMSGNVWEWCQDWYGEYNESSQPNPAGPSNGFKRIDRGGSCFSIDWHCRLSFRRNCSPAYRSNEQGVRIVLSKNN